MLRFSADISDVAWKSFDCGQTWCRFVVGLMLDAVVVGSYSRSINSLVLVAHVVGCDGLTAK